MPEAANCCQCVDVYDFTYFFVFLISIGSQVNLEQESRTKLLKLLGYSKEDLQKKVRSISNRQKFLQD